MPALLNRLSHPPAHAGPKSFRDFRNYYTPFDSLPVNVSVIVAMVLGCVTGAVAYERLESWPLSTTWGLGVAWLIVSGVYFVHYAAFCSEYGGASLVWLPWRRAWPWGFLAFTLPWLPFWLLSLLRLAATRQRAKQKALQIYC